MTGSTKRLSHVEGRGQFRYFREDSEEHHDKSQPGQSVFETQFKYGNLRYQPEGYTPDRGLRLRQKGEKIFQSAL